MKLRKLVRRFDRTSLALVGALLPLASVTARIAPGDTTLVSMNVDTPKTSALPAGLVPAMTAVSLNETDNQAYGGSTRGGAANQP